MEVPHTVLRVHKGISPVFTTSVAELADSLDSLVQIRPRVFNKAYIQEVLSQLATFETQGSHNLPEGCHPRTLLLGASSRQSPCIF
jgi:hypothetical protein